MVKWKKLMLKFQNTFIYYKIIYHISYKIEKQYIVSDSELYVKNEKAGRRDKKKKKAVFVYAFQCVVKCVFK